MHRIISNTSFCGPHAQWIRFLTCGDLISARTYATRQLSKGNQHERFKIFTGKLRSLQYKELMKVLEQHKAKMQIHFGHTPDIVITVPATTALGAQRIRPSKQASTTSTTSLNDKHENLASGTLPEFNVDHEELSPEFFEEGGFLEHDSLPFETLPMSELEFALQQDEDSSIIAKASKPQKAKRKKKQKTSKDEVSEVAPAVQRLSKPESDGLTKLQKINSEKKSRLAVTMQSLQAFMEVAIHANQLEQAHNAFHFQRFRFKQEFVNYAGTVDRMSAMHLLKNKNKDGNSNNHAMLFAAQQLKEADFRFTVDVYNALLRGFVTCGKLSRVHDLIRTMEKDHTPPNATTYSLYLQALLRVLKEPEVVTSPRAEVEAEMRKVVDDMAAKGISIDDLFRQCRFRGSERQCLLEAIRCIRGDYQPPIIEPPRDYTCPLVTPLNRTTPHETFEKGKLSPEAEKRLKEMRDAASIQWEREISGQIVVKSICNANLKPTDRVLFLRKQVEAHENSWRRLLKESFQQNLKALYSHSRLHRGMSLYPFLTVLDSEVYVRLMLEEIRTLAISSETYSPSLSVLQASLGSRVQHRYVTFVKQTTGIATKIWEMYDEYLEYCAAREGSSDDAEGGENKLNAREYYQHLRTHRGGGISEAGPLPWPSTIQTGIGRFLYDIILHTVKIDAHCLNSNKPFFANTGVRQMLAGFYSVYRNSGIRTKEEIKPHPYLSRMYRGAFLEELSFDIGMVPMLCPPVPWTSVHDSVFLLNSSPLIRLPDGAQRQNLMLASTPQQQMYPSLDALNVLGLCPWIVNKPILDLVIEVFLNNGDDKLEIPSSPNAEQPAMPKLTTGMNKKDRATVQRERAQLRRRRAEMYSLWCDALYKFSIASHFRDAIFYFPHNMDFRGRVYPCPPHFNHLGSDVTRGMLLFAEGKPLGSKGLDWLKLHLINLTGLKKREPLSVRIAYADEVMDKILDSADRPLDGEKWWMESDEPWQTLACCKELAAASRSPDPTAYISHLPIHQDGSCNGLQHYAALGRDLDGAREVNLMPMSTPQDVYSGVAALVERERSKDAAAGVKVAQVLENFIRRKVLKQTVMTVVYGVTRFGAHLQILKQLRDIDDFPQEYAWVAAQYLVQKTFFSLQEMFTATREIQDWFTNCARLVSVVCGDPVEWVTPLGLPIVQPYYKEFSLRSPLSFGDRLNPSVVEHFDMYQRPNAVKQKNAFPPNFIHSLDSSHMMLTALFCERKGVRFVSVHDCFWTHALTVEQMNKICREQFVALHSQPILEDLSAYMVKKFSYKPSDLKQDNSLSDLSKIKLNRILTQIPPKGTFKLESVLDSTYFFS